MQHPLEFYTQQIADLEIKASILKRKLRNLAIFRFAVFLIICFFVYLTFGKYPTVFIVALFGVLLFSFLVIQYINLKRKNKIVDAKITINKTEMKVLHRDFHHLETGNEFINHTHFYSNDIDLFGKGSFFQFLNRTATLQGKINLAQLLTANKIDKIQEKQNAINELEEKVKFRQHFTALASIETVKKSTDFIVKWITNYQTVFPTFLHKIPLLFSMVSLAFVVFIIAEMISFSILIYWFFVGIFVTTKFLKKTSKLFSEIDKSHTIFKQYYPLLQQIETENFTSKILKEQQKIITSEHKKASTIFKEFSKILDAFDNRNNVIIAIVGNGLFLTEINNAIKTEKWIKTYKHTVEKWVEVVAFFDAQNSLANFKFNHPSFVYPILNDGSNVLKAENLGHPLLKSDKRIDNNFEITEASFFIITGANMAGKSTFLRTVSLSIVMANCGLPVCATRFEYSPIRLITSMRTSDNLSEDESYFYSELKRLKFIVDEIATEKYFIILDEILKGTNSKDKALGSKKFVEKLTNSKSTGIIATHDVSLCALENEYKAIKNYYFDADIINDELFFDYKLKNGVCKNMNASFLLQKMEIV